VDLLRDHNFALVLQDQSWMPGPWEVTEKIDPINADFSYIRWLGDRKEIEKITTVWNKTVVDRTAELQSWVDVCQKIKKRGVSQFQYSPDGKSLATRITITRDSHRRRLGSSGGCALRKESRRR
jgi:hypothetical protein